jgi:hypothetical protein
MDSRASSKDCFPRGDRRIGKVIEAAWRDGARFDGWSEYFDYERWMRCARTALA